MQRLGVVTHLRFVAAIENLAADRADDEMLDVAFWIRLFAQVLDGGMAVALHGPGTMRAAAAVRYDFHRASCCSLKSHGVSHGVTKVTAPCLTA